MSYKYFLLAGMTQRSATQVFVLPAKNEQYGLFLTTNDMTVHDIYVQLLLFTQDACITSTTSTYRGGMSLISILDIVTCQAHPALVKRVQCTVRSFLILGSYH